MTEKLDFVRKTLGKLEMVEWDRYIDYHLEGDHYGKFYGWIEREEDEYKDFVILYVNISQKKIEDYTTSSQKYTEEIHEKLGFDSSEHESCRRIEEIGLEIENVVKLQ